MKGEAATERRPPTNLTTRLSHHPLASQAGSILYYLENATDLHSSALERALIKRRTLYILAGRPQFSAMLQDNDITVTSVPHEGNNHVQLHSFGSVHSVQFEQDKSLNFSGLRGFMLALLHPQQV